MDTGRIVMVASLVVLIVTGCIDTRLGKVDYDEPAEVTSNRSGVIILSSGLIDGISRTVLVFYTPEIILPGSMPPYKPAYFNEQDQQVFAESLAEELNRREVLRDVRLAEKDANAADVVINLFFVHTRQKVDMQQYDLNVVMQIVAGRQSFESEYDIVSNEGESLWTRLNTSAVQGKEKAAKKLMARLMPDIETFVASLE